MRGIFKNYAYENIAFSFQQRRSAAFKMCQNVFATGALPRTPMGNWSLRRSPSSRLGMGHSPPLVDFSISVSCLYCLKGAKFGQLILRKIIKIVATRCQDFNAKMHQIRFRLGLRPRPRWGSSQRSPRPPSWI